MRILMLVQQMARNSSHHLRLSNRPFAPLVPLPMLMLWSRVLLRLSSVLQCLLSFTAEKKSWRRIPAATSAATVPGIPTVPEPTTADVCWRRLQRTSDCDVR